MSNALGQTEDFGIWRVIPPEEKLSLINRAHSKGVLAISGAIFTCWTIAIALKEQTLVWLPLIIAPFIFQFATGRAWRQYRPRIMLEYLAARTAARRYAYTSRAHNLELVLIFRGTFEPKYHVDGADRLAILEALANNVEPVPVWIALFRDAVVIMSERNGGARLELSQLINPNLEMNDDETNLFKEGLEIAVKDKGSTDKSRYLLKSDLPAALLAFKQKLKQMLEKAAILPATPDIESFLD